MFFVYIYIYIFHARYEDGKGDFVSLKLDPEMTNTFKKLTGQKFADSTVELVVRNKMGRRLVARELAAFLVVFYNIIFCNFLELYDKIFIFLCLEP